MFLKAFIGLIILASLTVGALTFILPREQVIYLIQFRDFFAVSLPILGFGALIKYLCTCSRHD